MTDFHSPSAAQFGRVAVLMGGDSAEREISLLSGQAVLRALQACGVDAVGVDVGSCRGLMQTLERERAERAFIMLHGRKGEDGKVQALLELMDLPYTGSGVLACALAMDKVKCKQVWQAMGLPTPAWRVLSAETQWQQVIDELGAVFVKPVREGSSLGIRKASSAEQVREAYENASRFDALVIAEQWISGAEFTITMLGQQVLPVIELQASGREFYDFHAKYESDETRYICPAPLGAEKTAHIQQLALQAYAAVDCRGWGRVDVMQDAQENFWLLEVNTIPGMTSHSLVPMAAREAGLDFNQLVLEILATSLNIRQGG